MTTIDRNVKYVVEAFEDGETLFVAHSHVLSFAVGSFLDLCQRYGIRSAYDNEINVFDDVGRGFPVVRHTPFEEAKVCIYVEPVQ